MLGAIRKFTLYLRGNVPRNGPERAEHRHVYLNAIRHRNGIVKFDFKTGV